MTGKGNGGGFRYVKENVDRTYTELNKLRHELQTKDEEIERLGFNCNNWKGKADLLAAQIELLTVCECSMLKIARSSHPRNKCQGCKNMAKLKEGV
jgi:hypothetical protein